MESRRILVYGDLHLWDRNTGGHKDYRNFSAYILGEITRIAEEKECNLIVGLGDFINGSIVDLSYISEIHKELTRHKEITGKTSVSLRGNHDRLSDGRMSLFDYFIDNNLLANIREIKFGNVAIHLINHGEEGRRLNIVQGGKNIVLAHNTFTIKDYVVGVKEREYHLKEWKDVDFILSGHLHSMNKAEYRIHRDGVGTKIIPVLYPGCPTHVEYEEYLKVKKRGDRELSRVIILECYDGGYNIHIENIVIPDERNLFETKEERKEIGNSLLELMKTK